MTEQTETGAAPVVAPDPAATRAAITREAALKALLDAIKEEYATARTEVQDLMTRHYKATGTTKLDAVLPDGTKVGSMTRSAGEAIAKVTDPEAFRVWVRDTYPTEHTVTVVPAHTEVGVTPTFQAQILAEATAAGVAQYIDPETSELHDVPGVTIVPGKAPTHALTFARASKADARPGRERVGDAWRSGGLAEILPGLAPMPPAIETAPAAEAVTSDE